MTLEERPPLRPIEPPSDVDIELRLLMEAIYLKYSYDFRNYTTASQKRRVLHALDQLGLPSISALQERVLRDPVLFGRLLQFLTIPVSEMFRDPSYFLALRQHVVPILHTYASVKVWVAGCSTGEEVYSLAILLQEEGLLERSLIYATDINSQALRVAEQGIFGIERAESFSANYLKAGGKRSLADYYTAHYGHIVLDKELRKNVVFADHSLATDSVFAEMHLISCRNVLIYFDADLQNRALDLFRQSLCHRGFLGLGMKESLRFSNQAPAFEDVAVVEKIYQKKPSID